MNNYFNVEEFQSVIDNIITKSTAAEEAMNKIAFNVDNLKNVIGSAENNTLYQAWDELKLTLDRVSKTYLQRKEEFLVELKNYREFILANNDEMHHNIKAAIDLLGTIAGQIDGL